MQVSKTVLLMHVILLKVDFNVITTWLSFFIVAFKSKKLQYMLRKLSEFELDPSSSRKYQIKIRIVVALLISENFLNGVMKPLPYSPLRTNCIEVKDNSVCLLVKTALKGLSFCLYLLFHAKYHAVNEKIRLTLDRRGSWFDGKRLSGKEKLGHESEEVFRLAAMHHCLYTLLNDTHGMFSLVILIKFTTWFFELTALSFAAVVYEDEDLWTITKIGMLCKAFLVTGWITAYIVVCGCIRHKATQTGIIISEGMLKVKDERVKEELRFFSHQLLHTKIELTAFGFFTLDFGLITSITGVFVTSLVLLVQIEYSKII
ncbi:uncharacterized protein LOC124159843 [Ischnura elegans]|uniref:uncharacterized protein LOC124159843 n=1 Tax=Ischnura elegans TaxID=197161 RepID=UPI001ED87205|nr:uncharacterized protein LOC124159843 [Ischnura elegans]